VLSHWNVVFIADVLAASGEDHQQAATSRAKRSSRFGAGWMNFFF
jgi:hypothetical protein